VKISREGWKCIGAAAWGIAGPILLLHPVTGPWFLGGAMVACALLALIATAV
jgi:hypothetical protein